MYDGESVTVKGSEFRIEVRRGTGSTARVRIKKDRILMSFPESISREEFSSTYRHFKEWAVKRLEEIDHTQLEPTKPRFIGFSDGQEVELMGEKFVVRTEEGSSLHSSSSTLKNSTIRLSLATHLNEEQRKRHISILTRRTISSALLGKVEQRVRGINEKSFNFQYNAVRLKDHQTKWGSCSVNGRNINLSFRLLFAPEEVLDYVIVHELAHLKHHDHSDEFWKLVESVVPDYKEKKKWLRQNGHMLGPAQQNAALQSEEERSTQVPTT